MAEFSGNRKKGGQFGKGNNLAKKGALTKRKKKFEDEEEVRKEFLKAVTIAEKKHGKKFWDVVLDNCFQGDNVLLAKIALKMMPEIVKPTEQESGWNVTIVNYSDMEKPKKGKK